MALSSINDTFRTTSTYRFRRTLWIWEDWKSLFLCRFLPSIFNYALMRWRLLWAAQSFQQVSFVPTVHLLPQHSPSISQHAKHLHSVAPGVAIPLGCLWTWTCIPLPEKLTKRLAKKRKQQQQKNLKNSGHSKWREFCTGRLAPLVVIF